MKRMAVWLISALGLSGMSTFGITGSLPGMPGGNRHYSSDSSSRARAEVSELHASARRNMDTRNLTGAELDLSNAQTFLDQLDPSSASDKPYFQEQLALEKRLSQLNW